MFRLKKEISLLTLFIFCLFTLLPAASSLGIKEAQAATLSLTDVQGHWAEKQITDWYNKGLTKGYEDGTFRPDNGITRAEFASLVNRVLNITKITNINFPDVNSNDWFYSEIAKAKNAGYLSGYQDGTMRPNNMVTRQEVAAMISKVLKLIKSEDDQAVINAFADRASIPEWSKDAIALIVSKGFMKGYPDKTFKADKVITRAEAIATLDRVNTYVDDKNIKVEKHKKHHGGGSSGGGSSHSGSDSDKDDTDATIANEADLINAVSSTGKGNITLDENITLTETLVVDRAVTINGKNNTIKGNVKVDKTGVTLNDFTIAGNFEAGEGIGEGDLTLNNVKITGTTDLNGGGSNSIHLKGSTSFEGTLTLNKTGLRLFAEDETVRIKAKVLIKKPARIEAPSTATQVFEQPIEVTKDFEGDGPLEIAAPLSEMAELIINHVVANILMEQDIANFTANKATHVTGNGIIIKAVISCDGVELAKKPKHVIPTDIKIKIKINGKEQDASTIASEEISTLIDEINEQTNNGTFIPASIGDIINNAYREYNVFRQFLGTEEKLDDLNILIYSLRELVKQQLSEGLVMNIEPQKIESKDGEVTFTLDIDYPETDIDSYYIDFFPFIDGQSLNKGVKLYVNDKLACTVGDEGEESPDVLGLLFPDCKTLKESSDTKYNIKITGLDKGNHDVILWAMIAPELTFDSFWTNPSPLALKSTGLRISVTDKDDGGESVDKSALEKAIVDAEKLIDNHLPGEDVSKEAYVALKAAIGNAQAVVDNKDATLDEVNGVLDELKKAISDFNGAIIENPSEEVSGTWSLAEVDGHKIAYDFTLDVINLGNATKYVLFSEKGTQIGEASPITEKIRHLQFVFTNTNGFKVKFYDNSNKVIAIATLDERENNQGILNFAKMANYKINNVIDGLTSKLELADVENLDFDYYTLRDAVTKTVFAKSDDKGVIKTLTKILDEEDKLEVVFYNADKEIVQASLLANENPENGTLKFELN